MVVSGLPGSGKTTLARRLAPGLQLPLLDKDDILERLFDCRGAGDSAWRRKFSRESDRLLEEEAQASSGAVLVSHWRLPGMPADSGTPTGWLLDLPGALVHVRCICDPALAARRFLDRRRHPGHLDAGASYDELVARFRGMGMLRMEPAVEIDTSGEPVLDVLVSRIRARFGK